MQKLFKGLAACMVCATLAPLHGSTLLQLSLNDMIRKSTSIVHGTAHRTYSAFHGSMIYSHYQIQVSETLKGSSVSQIDLFVPGGVAGGLQQSYAGSPTLVEGQDYVIFLWASKTGVTQIIGLSQGLFAVTANSTGQPIIVRAAASETMLNASGQVVMDSDIKMLLSDLRTRVPQVLSGKVGP